MIRVTGIVSITSSGERRSRMNSSMTTHANIMPTMMLSIKLPIE